ncbi:MAG: DapH/DapD/GlmU-related protein [Bradyrhizobium sp.]|uniref:DapH/DapD/GlmU-related protein n=1 Tax=Bradyrhizobium sp. TaxID=376 RepID=UPI003D12F612
MALLHARAEIDASVTIGASTRVWQFASVLRGARIGERCVIGAGAHIDGARIGDDCRIQANAYIPHGVEIGDRVFVGPGAIFCNDMWPDATRDGIDHAAIAAGTTIRVKDGASIGAGAIILPGVTIGAGAVVAAGAVVERNVPDGLVIKRNGYTAFQPDERRRMRLIQ